MKAFQRVEASSAAKASKSAALPDLAAGNFNLIATAQRSAPAQSVASLAGDFELAKAIDGMFFGCDVDAAPNVTLSFDEYDRTAAELAGGPHTGTGPRRVLGDAITDMNGNYIFRFSFDMTLPGLEDAADIAPGEDVNAIVYPDVIVKLLGFRRTPYCPKARRITTSRISSASTCVCRSPRCRFRRRASTAV